MIVWENWGRDMVSRWMTFGSGRRVIAMRKMVTGGRQVPF